MRGIVISVLGVLVGSVAWAQQPSIPPSCEEDLAQALQRSFTQQTMAAQEREALARYFQRELAKLRQEQETLKQQLAQSQALKPEEK